MKSVKTTPVSRLISFHSKGFAPASADLPDFKTALEMVIVSDGCNMNLH